MGRRALDGCRQDVPVGLVLQFEAVNEVFISFDLRFGKPAAHRGNGGLEGGAEVPG